MILTAFRRGRVALALSGAVLAAAFLAPGAGRAADCEPMAVALKAHPEIATAKPARAAQFWFAAGFFVGYPPPSGPPHGDRAMAVDLGHDVTEVVFMTDAMVCEMLEIGGDARKAFIDAGEGKVNLPGDGT